MSLVDRLFQVCLCTLCIVLTLNRLFYPVLYTTTVAGVLVLWTHRTELAGRSFYSLAFPFVFFTLVAGTPNNPFTDLPVASVMAASFVCGLAAALCTEASVRVAILLMGISLSVQVCYAIGAGLPQNLMWNGRLSLLFDHPAVLAHVVSFPMLYILCQEQQKTIYIRVISLLILVACLGITALTTSRGAFVGLFCAAMLLLCTRFRGHFWTVALSGMIFCAAAFLMAPAEHRTRLISAIQNPFADANFVSRMAIWEPAVDGFQQAPLFGQGIRRFKEYHQTYINTHQADMETRYPLVERDIANPHNLYVGLLFACGLVGTLLLCATLVQASRTAFSSGELFLPCLILFYLGSGLVDYQLHRKDGIFLLFFLLGRYFSKQLATTQRANENVISGQLWK